MTEIVRLNISVVQVNQCQPYAILFSFMFKIEKKISKQPKE